MAKKFLTDEEVEREIARLTASPEVKLEKEENRIKYRRRQYMYVLRNMEKRGKELAAWGITMDNMEAILFGEAKDEQ